MVERRPTVVITGASAGVGRATAKEFARHGYQIGLIARGEKALEETRAELQAMGAKALALPADVADADQVEKAAASAEAELGPIDVWVNSAMVTVFSPVSAMTPEEFKDVTDTTYLGYVYGTLAALGRMRARNRGTIVQVGSALAYRSIPLQSAYCGAKSAIRGFTDSLRSELIHDRSRVRLTMVQLPAHDTPQFEWARNKLESRPQPVPPIYRPEVAGRAIYHAAQDAPRELWVGSSTVKAIVGNMVMPWVLDKLMAKQAYSGQQTGEPALKHRPNNLEHPVAGLHRQRGRFGKHAKTDAIEVKAEALGKAALVAAAGIGVVALAAGVRGARRLLH